jgi:glycosyltransferase involved in cell wall biosynthesis
MGKKLIIGTNALEYPQKRNFGDLPFEKFSVQKIPDICRIIDYFYFKLKKRNHPFFHNTFFDFGINKANVLHFFNTVSLSNKPWVVTFENEVPRPNLNSKYLTKRLTHNSCKKIIAFSHRAKEIETFFLNKHPELKAAVLNKLIVLQPSQKLQIESIDEKKWETPLCFTFVGVDFFRKGGAEVLKAAEKLINEGFEFKLNIVSRLKYGGWKDEHITEMDVHLAKEIIEKHKAVITHYYSLPANDILKLFSQSHVGLLPSYGETYGYSGLEAQACGCPIITPDMPPFDEFNNNEMGWLIKVPLKSGNGTMESDLRKHNLLAFQEALTIGLYESMKEAIINNELLRKKAAASLKNIRENHSPLKAAQLLEEIYLNAILK